MEENICKEMDGYPKLLVVAAFPPMSAGGSWPMLEQLLMDWPKERLLWWHIGGECESNDVSYCKTFTPGEISKVVSPNKRFNTIRCRLFELFYLPKAIRHLTNVIMAERPDILWIIPYGFTIPIFHKVYRNLQTRLHVSVHDMADTEGMVQLLGRKRASLFQNQLQELYALSGSRDCVTQEMAAELERCTGEKPDIIIKYGAEPEQISMLQQKSYGHRSDVIKVGYAGTIVAEEAFMLFVEAVRQLMKGSRYQVEIHLFSIHPYASRSWFDGAIIKESGYLHGEAFTKAYLECDWGLCLMNLHENTPRYNKYSIPCKLTKTLSEGLPLICLANRDSSLYKLVEKYGAGFVSDCTSAVELAGQLADLFEPSEVNAEMYSRMAFLLSSECNVQKNRSRITNLLCGRPLHQ